MDKQKKKAESTFILLVKGWGSVRDERTPANKRWAKKLARRASRRLGRAQCRHESE
jgi:hypothetical protein